MIFFKKEVINLIILNFFKIIIFQLAMFLSFICQISLVQAKPKNNIIIDNVVINKKEPNDKNDKLELNIKDDKETNNTVNYIIKIPEEIKTVSNQEEKKDAKYYFFVIMNKLSWVLEACFSGFLGIIGGYFAQKVIDQINKEKTHEEIQEKDK